MFRALTNKELVEQYCDEVVSGKRIAGKLERAAVLRHLEDLRKAKKRGYRFDEKLADQACEFFPMLLHTTGEWAGQPFDLKPFQRFIVWCVFGWVRIEDGFRRFHHAFISLARGNGKSPFAAALLLLLFAFDCPVEIRAECYTAATKKDQAKIVFEEVKRFVQKNPELRTIIKTLLNAMSIPEDGSTLKPIGQDSENQDGLNIHAAVVDEIHAFQERHRQLWDKLITGLKRRQSMMVVITTAGSEESELWEEVYDMSVQIVSRDSNVEADDRFVFICEIDDEDDPFDEACWPKANPMLEEGVVKYETIRSVAEMARINPAAKNTLLRYNCNKKVTSSLKMLTPEVWARGDGKLPKLLNRACHGGFDWGWKDDLAAAALVFPLDSVAVGELQKRRFAAIVQAWIPEETNRDLTQEPWASWISDGWLDVTSGNTTDTAAIYKWLGEQNDLYEISTIACDGNNCREFGSRVEPEFGIKPFWFGQTHGKYNEPFRELLAALNEERFLHGGNPLLAWSANNVVASADSRDYIKPEKRRSKEKIDPFCALLMGLSECLFAEQLVSYEGMSLEL